MGRCGSLVYRTLCSVQLVFVGCAAHDSDECDRSAEYARRGESFRWELGGTKETRTFQPLDLPASGTYSVRMDLALLDSIGGRLQIVADGITFVSWGDGLILSDAQEVQLVPGEMDHTNFGVSMIASA